MRGLNVDRFTEVDGKKVGTNALDYEDYENSGTTAYCLRESKAFDKYCHQYNAKEGKPPRYADFTGGPEGDSLGCEDGWEEVDEDGDPIVTTEAAYCLAQDCMFEYCLWRRDQQLVTCEEFVDDWEAAVEQATLDANGEDQCRKTKLGVCVATKVDVTVGNYTGRSIGKAQKKNGARRPGWGNVYNYNNMHADLDTNEDT